MVNDPLLSGGAALPGYPLPLGVSHGCDGVNFSVFSRHATAVTLLLFDTPGDQVANMCLSLDPLINKTGDIWHIGLTSNNGDLFYLWQMDGHFAPKEGHRFNAGLALLDPYAKALVGTDSWDFGRCCEESGSHVDPLTKTENGGYKPKCLAQNTRFDWQGDSAPNHSWSATVIYETHVRGFTAHRSSKVAHPGTYLGVIEKIPYLQSLGITAIELLPIQEFHENELPRHNPIDGTALKNYWGYSTVAFFAPKESYSSRQYDGVAVIEFKTMVKALHKAGIEVILDVVFNHTAEGNHRGPTLSFRGLDNAIYYILEEDKTYYKNYSGTGNTLNCNHPVVRDFILDCLRYWVVVMHIDGFRFDLASILGRDEAGNLLSNPPLLERIAEDPVLRSVKLIAEAWDAGGAYQVGHFQGARWSEWNGRFRDDVRRFWRGDSGMNGALAHRFCGSADIYQSNHKQPLHSINFITCHDGFTLVDLVSYEYKHNEANGENNADGTTDNFSRNYGEEGPTDNVEIQSIRQRTVKNMLATLLLSRGVPMLLGGDEMGRSQQGNNNAYCQDNELSWYDWSHCDQHREVVDFLRQLITLRKRFRVFRTPEYYDESTIHWFGREFGSSPNWHGAEGVLGCLLKSTEDIDEAFIVLFNASDHTAIFDFPDALGLNNWKLLFDTSSPSNGNEHRGRSFQRQREKSTYTLRGKSLALLTKVN